MDTTVQRPITIAILAMGGEGGGVLAEWIVDVAEHGGYVAQMTSVPGVAQRTGATNYYVELFPKHGTKANSPASVLGLSLTFFVVSALIEGAITVAVISALENIQPGFVRHPAPGRTVLVGAVGLTAVLLAAGGVVFASTAPDGIENLALQAGLSKPLTSYGGGTGVAGVGLIFFLLFIAGRTLRKRSA